MVRMMKLYLKFEVVYSCLNHSGFHYVISAFEFRLEIINGLYFDLCINFCNEPPLSLLSNNLAYCWSFKCLKSLCEAAFQSPCRVDLILFWYYYPNINISICYFRACNLQKSVIIEIKNKSRIIFYLLLV